MTKRHETIDARALPPVIRYRDIACNPDTARWFYPPITARLKEGNGRFMYKEAKAICKELCPHLAECLLWAVQTRQEHGCWGGLTPAERRTLTPEMVERWYGQVIDDAQAS